MVITGWKYYKRGGIIMFTILMDNNKFLQITSRATLYQGENYVDTFQIIVPKTYNDIDLRPFTVCLEYVDEYQNAYLDILVPDNEDYKENVRKTW